MARRDISRRIRSVGLIGSMICVLGGVAQIEAAPVARANCDCNGDLERDISDVVYLLLWLFLGSDAPVALEPPEGASALANGDCDGDGARGLNDAIYLLQWVFIDGAAPVQSLLGPTARAEIGVGGGSLSSPDGSLSLTIPAGALAEPTEISIAEVPPDKVPEHLRAIEPDRVYKLGPDGQQFLQPVAVTLSLAGGNELAVLLTDSNGVTELAAEQKVRLGDSERLLSGQLRHFSYTAARTVGGFTVEVSVNTRRVKVGGTVAATASATGPVPVRAYCYVDPLEGNSFDLDGVDSFMGVAECERNTSNTPRSEVHLWTCFEPGSETLSVGYTVTVTAALRRFLPNLPEGETSIFVEIDVVCEDEPEQGIPEGTTPLPFGMTAPDYLWLFSGPWASIFAAGGGAGEGGGAGVPGSGPYAAIAGQNGMVVMDLSTRLSALNMTFQSPIGGLGSSLLGVQPISRPNPGPDSPAAVAGVSAAFGQSGIRNWSPGEQVWGFTQLLLDPTLDAATSGGGLVADEMVITARGLTFVRYQEEPGLFGIVSPSSLLFSEIGGSLRSAVPEAGAGLPVLGLSAGTDGGTTSTLWAHLRQSGQQAVELATLPDPDARRLRCLPEEQTPAALDGRIPAMVTGFTTGKAWYFLYDPAQPAAAPQIQELDAGAGALGVQFGLRSSGDPWAVVSNFNAASMTIFLFDAQGQLTGSETLPLPEGCTRSGHAAPFSHDGKDYIAGTCYDNGSYFVQRYTGGQN